MNPELEAISHRILSALFNGAYQGLLLTVLVWLGLKLVPRANAATRHAVLFVTLLVVALLPVGHFWLAGSGRPMGSRTEGSTRSDEAPASGKSSVAPADSPAIQSQVSRTEPREPFEAAMTFDVFDLEASLTADTPSASISTEPDLPRDIETAESEPILRDELGEFSENELRQLLAGGYLSGEGSTGYQPNGTGRIPQRHGTGELQPEQALVLPGGLPDGAGASPALPAQNEHAAGTEGEHLNSVLAGSGHEESRIALADRERLADQGLLMSAATRVAVSAPADAEAAPAIEEAFSQSPLPVMSWARAFVQNFLRADFPRVVPLSREFSLPRGVALVLVGCWIACAAARLVGLTWQCRSLVALKRRGACAPEPLTARFKALCDEMRVTRRTRLLFCPELAVPVVVGFGRPAVLLPTAILQQAEASPEEQILRHELAHVRRRDDWASLLQQCIKAVLFFHPAVWWLCRRLTVEREIACDDHVLAASRAPRDYALFLTEFASQVQGRDWAPALAAWSNKSQLNERVTMILDSKRNASPRLARASVGVLTTAAALTAVIGLHAGPRVSVATTETNPDSAVVVVSAQTEPEIAVSVSADVQTEAQSEAVAELDGPDGTVTFRRAAAFTLEGKPAVASAKVDSGPKPKPSRESVSFNLPPSPVPTAPRPMAAPAPDPGPLPPMAPGTAQESALARVPQAAPHPLPPASPAAPLLAAPPASPFNQPVPEPPSETWPRKVADEDSLERRLERLERMVESLLEREKGSKDRNDFSHDFDFFSLKGPAWDQNFGDAKWKDAWKKHAEDFRKLAEKFSNFGPSEEEVARIQEETNKAAERAAREVERAVKEVERARVEGERHARMKQSHGHAEASRHALEMRRNNLESRRRSLEQQIEALDHQLEQLEAEQDRIDEEREEQEEQLEQSEPSADSPEPENPVEQPGPKRKL